MSNKHTPQEAWEIALAEVRSIAEADHRMPERFARETDGKLGGVLSFHRGILYIQADHLAGRYLVENWGSTLNASLSGLLDRAVELRPVKAETANDIPDLAEDIRENGFETENEITWSRIMGHLQRLMPPASFNTWVNGSCTPVDWHGDTFRVRVRSAYARDWLESRYSDEMNRKLSEVMGRSATVSLTLEGDLFDGENQDADRIEANRDIDPDKEIEVTADWVSFYEQTIRIDRAVVVNGYFRRHLREIGHDLGWLYIGFRQSAYGEGAREHHRLATLRLSSKQIAGWSGTTERTYFNRASRPETWQKLRGLVELVDEAPLWNNTADNKLRRVPRKFRIAMTLPLTGADAHSLAQWLAANVERCGGPAGVIASACKTPLGELLPEGADANGMPPQTVHAIVRDLFAGALEDKELNALAEGLHLHIQPPGDLIVITLFFIEHVLPLLGSGQGWMLTLLRDRCYVDPETGIVRNQVTVPGGYADVASWLGIERPKTVWEWLREPKMMAYVSSQEIDKPGGEGDKWSKPRTFKVLLTEVPLEIIQAFLSNPVADFSVASGATFSVGVADFSVAGGATFSRAVADFSVVGGAFFRVFKTLKPLNPTPKTLKNSQPPTPAQKSPVPFHKPNHENRGTGVGNMAYWDLGYLLSLNGVTKNYQKKLHGAGATGETFAGWLVYSFTRAGAGVKDPVSNAIIRTLEAPRGGPGGSVSALMRMPPHSFKNQLDRALAGQDCEDPDFDSVLGDTPLSGLRNLSRCLFGGAE